MTWGVRRFALPSEFAATGARSAAAVYQAFRSFFDAGWITPGDRPPG